MRGRDLCLVVSCLWSTVAAAQDGTARSRPVATRAPIELSIDGLNARVLTAREGVVPPARTVLLAGLGASYLAAAGTFEVSGQLRRSTLNRDLGFGDLTLARPLGSFTPQVAVAWRTGYDATTGEIHGATHTFARLGTGWRHALTATPLALHARLGLYLPLREGVLAGGAVGGWEGESAIRIAIGARPLEARLAFRFERFTADRAVQETSHLSAGLVWSGGAR